MILLLTSTSVNPYNILHQPCRNTNHLHCSISMTYRCHLIIAVDNSSFIPYISFWISISSVSNPFAKIIRSICSTLFDTITSAFNSVTLDLIETNYISDCPQCSNKQRCGKYWFSYFTSYLILTQSLFSISNSTHFYLQF